MASEGDIKEEIICTGERSLVRAASRRSYLITLYTPRKGAPVVLLQASHSNQSRRFEDLASAFRYLEKLGLKQKAKEPEP